MKLGGEKNYAPKVKKHPFFYFDGRYCRFRWIDMVAQHHQKLIPSLYNPFLWNIRNAEHLMRSGLFDIVAFK